MKNFRRIIAAAAIAAVLAAPVSPVRSGDAGARPLSRGVWVSVFSEKRVHFSKGSAADLVDFCARNAIDDIYLQVYRAGEAWYDSGIAGKARYRAMTAAAGGDPIDVLIAKANAKGIRVYAWINVLSLAGNMQAPIIRKYGAGVLTRDKGLRPSAGAGRVKAKKGKKGKRGKKAAGAEGQIFLEPGDERVVTFTLSVVQEIMDRYPGLSGFHLDYIRYPYNFSSKIFFGSAGAGFGYGERNVARFKRTTGLDPFKAGGWHIGLTAEWNAWMRGRVTALARQITARVKKQHPGWNVSCAVLPSPARAAAGAYQDWASWINTGVVDYVVLMNYTRDDSIFARNARDALAAGSPARIRVGLGAYMLKDRRDVLVRSLRALEKLRPAGVVFYSYDDVSRPGMKEAIR
ncbi:MAG TPA: family 10 glycosylhydrolase [bacterium]|nr:family 10 glycosylhydrolase [bacterium]